MTDVAEVHIMTRRNEKRAGMPAEEAAAYAMDNATSVNSSATPGWYGNGGRPGYDASTSGRASTALPRNFSILVGLASTARSASAAPDPAAPDPAAPDPAALDPAALDPAASAGAAAASGLSAPAARSKKRSISTGNGITSV